MGALKRSVERFDNTLANSKLPAILKNKYVFGGTAIVIFLLLGSFLFSFSSVDINIPTYTVKRADFLVSITESGEIKAKNSKVISAPRVRGQLKITFMVPEGTYVQPGDTVLKFDPNEANVKLRDAEAQLELTLSEKRKLMANQLSSAAQSESDLKSAKLSYELSKLNLEQMKFEAEAEQQKAKLQHEKDSLSYNQTLQSFESKKIIRESELAKMEIEIKQKKSDLEKAQREVDNLTLTASAEGLIVYEHNWSTRSKFAVGDTPWRGQTVMSLPDLSAMESKTFVNEVDVSKIKQGQEVEVTLDAFQDTSFTAVVADVAKLGKKKERESNIKVFDIIVDINGMSELLKPGMTTGNKIIINEIPDTLFIPQEAVFEKEGQHFVFVKNGSGFDEREITVGEKSEDYIIVVNGLQNKEIVALRDPNEEDENSENAGTNGISIPGAGK